MRYRLKYYGLNKEERKELNKEYYKTDTGERVNKRLNRLLFTGIIGILFSILIFLSRNYIWELIISITLFVASAVFIIGGFRLRIRVLNEYLVKKGKK